MKQKLHLALALLLTLVALTATTLPARARVIHVNNSKTTGGDGNSWDTAYKELADALIAAQSGDEIWVAKETYYPQDIAGNGTTDRDRAFVIPPGVGVYGGFDGRETNRDSRDWVKNQTILSGDIGNKDDNTDNCYHVVIMALKNGETATLDGFTVTGGKTKEHTYTNITVNGILISQNSGGGVCASGEATLTHNTIYGNTATSGGGVSAENNATLTHNTIYGNTASYGGGGVYATTGATLTHNTIYGNTASNGGGVYTNASTTLTHNTIYGNTASNGGGVYAYATTTLNNNILWGNTLKGTGKGKDLYVYDSPSSGSHNLIGSTVEGSGAYTGTDDLIGPTYDPRFVKIDADTKTYDFRLTPYSPCIATGKPLDDDTPTDMGAYPYLVKADKDGIVYVNASVDTSADNYMPDGSSWANALTDLSDALVANATLKGIKEIWVAKGSYYPQDIPDESVNPSDDPRDRTFVIPPGVGVYGGFDGRETDRNSRDWVKNQTILSGVIKVDGQPDNNCYHVVIMALKDGETATLDGFTVTGGKAKEQTYMDITVNGIPISQSSGGGVFAYGNATTLTHNTIYGNTALYGGGVFAQNNATLTHNTIYGNKASSYGGGVYATTGATLTHNTIYGNTASDGGGVYANGGATLTHNTIYGNTASDGGGGGVYASGKVTLINNTIYGNTATYGGGVFVKGATTTLNNNILWGNTLEDGGKGKDLFVINYASASGSHNLIGSTIEVEEDGDYTGTADLIGPTYDPRFVDPDNGDFRLLEGSPAIDKGDNEAYLTAMNIEGFSDDILDAAGNPRFKGKAIDMGAYEYQWADKPEITHHTLTLEVAPGIDLYGYTAGSHQIADGDHLHLQFIADDRTLTPEDILFLVDGVDTPFEIPTGADTYFSYILNPITADHTVLIALREYTVTLPEVEGVTYNVGTGAHKVAYGAPFSFTLSGDFDPEQVHVYNNDIEIPSEGTSLTYTIDRVMGPVTITIEGLATSNASLTQGIRLAITNCELRITNEMPNAVDVSIYTLTGQNVVQLRALRGSRTITLPAGVYIVRAGTQSWKVIVN